jgi:hypothetical protein
VCVCVCVHTDVKILNLRTVIRSASYFFLCILLNFQNKLIIDCPQYDRSAAIVIAQQYTSATFVLLRFHSPHENIRHEFKKCYFANFCNIYTLSKSETAEHAIV